MKITPIDHRRVFSERVQNRKVVYLDNNMWILLRDGGAADACREKCQEEVTAGRAVFPVSYAAVSELFGISSSALRTQQAVLMDALSLGVTLRSPEIVCRVEARNLYEYLFEGATPRVLRDESFTSLPDYAGTGELNFPAETPANVVEQVVRGWNGDDLPGRSLRWLSEFIPTEAHTQRHAEASAKYVSLMEDMRARRLADPVEREMKRDPAIMRERKALFVSQVVPTVRALLLRDCDNNPKELHRRISVFEAASTSERELTKLFRSTLPSLEVSAQLHGMRAVDRQRRTRPQDFWDVDHASFAMVYADAFVSADGGLTSLLEAKSHPPCAAATVLKTIDALERWLADLE